MASTADDKNIVEIDLTIDNKEDSENVRLYYPVFYEECAQYGPFDTT